MRLAQVFQAVDRADASRVVKVETTGDGPVATVIIDVALRGDGVELNGCDLRERDSNRGQASEWNKHRDESGEQRSTNEDESTSSAHKTTSRSESGPGRRVTGAESSR